MTTAPRIPVRSSIWNQARLCTAAVLVLGAIPATLPAQSLRGSKATVEKMYWFAQSNRLQFHRTAESVQAAAGAGRLVELPEIGRGYELAGGVGWPYVTRETKQFLETFAPQVERACGAPLIVTSATRPTSRQPRNANARSVHPAGVALDFRRPPRGPCQEWMRKALLELERRGYIEAIEERHPVHFHIAVLTPPGRARTAPTLQLAVRGTPVPRVVTTSTGDVAMAGDPLDASVPAATPAIMRLRESAADRRFVGTRAAGHMPFSRLLPVASSMDDMSGEARKEPVAAAPAAATATAAATTESASLPARDIVAPALAAAAMLTGREGAEREQYDDEPPAAAPQRTYKVRIGDTLWDVARKLHVPVSALQKANGLGKRAIIKPGMELQVPDTTDHATR